MRGWTVFLSARGAVAALCLVGVIAVLVQVGGVMVLELTIDPTELPRFTPLWEFAPMLLGIYLAVLLSPRLATWELPGLLRVRLRSGLTAVLGALVPAAIPWFAHLGLPTDARWWDISCNVAFFTAGAFVATAWLGRIAGPIVGLVAYFTTIILQQMTPALASYFPVSGASTNLIPHPMSALLMVGLAGITWFTTMGQSQLASKLQRNT